MESFLEWFHYFTLTVLWACIVLNFRIFRRRSRQLREWENQAKSAFYTDQVEVTGLTPLQIQIAVDASMAAFHQRIEELQRSNRDHG